MIEAMTPALSWVSSAMARCCNVTHNSRNSLNDLYQELLDALMYVGQYELENVRVALNRELSVELKMISAVVKAQVEGITQCP
jgi:hypothetical protein